VFIETAAALGARVCRDALWAGNRCNWIGPVMEPIGGRWRQVHKIAGPDFYGGTSGIAMSLANLYGATGERVFKRTALGAINHALSRTEDIEPFARIGFYSGWLGIALAAYQVANLLDADATSSSALRLVNSLQASKLDLNNADVLAGSAGAIVALLKLREEFIADDALLQLAVRLGDHLIETAVKAETGWSWGDLHKPDSGAFGNLTGYSHGAAGIGCSLFSRSRRSRLPIRTPLVQPSQRKLA
jgi:lantibiotic modifying enzyme